MGSPLSQIDVSLSTRSYPVIVGPGALASLADLLPQGASKIVAVTQPNIGIELDANFGAQVVYIENGEGVKSFTHLESLCRKFVELEISRSDVIVAIGGGVVTDLVGFAASVFHRGVPCINVATSLVGQVDAAIGGKTGINLPEGKNLVGAFSQPIAVICDTNHLGSLAKAEMQSGYGEMAKYCLLGIDDLEDLAFDTQIARCIELKAQIVAEDELETSGRRAILNYGHTLGHAIEGIYLARAGQQDPKVEVIKHGVAVGIGLAFAGSVAFKLGRISRERLERHFRVLDYFGLAKTIPGDLLPDDLLRFMGHDKKAMFSTPGSGISFVLDGESGVELVPNVPEDILVETIKELY